MAEKNANNAAGAIIAGIAGLTAAAIGAYYLYGHDDAKKNRAKVKSWMLKAKGEVLEELEKAQEVTESAYVSAVDTVAAKYKELKNIDPEELSSFMSEMRDHWNGIKRTFASRPGAAKKSMRTTKPSAKKSSK
jgi:hypothetical protein